MNNFVKTVERVRSGERGLVVVGLGYVGLQLACAFAARGVRVVGFDVDESRVASYNNGVDVTGSVDSSELANVKFVDRITDVEPASIGAYIVCVPTPIDENDNPVYDYVVNATQAIVNIAKPNDVVVYESTIGPGTTVELCSGTFATYGIRPNVDVAIGFSPERLQPGVGGSRTVDLPKIVSADNDDALAAIVDLYSVIIDRDKLHSSSSTTTAELAKLLENIKRDVNVALVNEFAKICDGLGVNVQDVIALAETKPNFNNSSYRPGLVGGHCISVDPHYVYDAMDKAGIFSSVIRTARRVNELHPHWIAKRFTEIVNKRTSRYDVAVLGATFKENCNDVRNAKVWETIDTLRRIYGFNVTVVDPIVADGKRVVASVPDHVVAVLVVVAHDEFANLLPELATKLDNPKLIVDLKNLYADSDVSEFTYIQL